MLDGESHRRPIQRVLPYPSIHTLCRWRSTNEIAINVFTESTVEKAKFSCVADVSEERKHVGIVFIYYCRLGLCNLEAHSCMNTGCAQGTKNPVCKMCAPALLEAFCYVKLPVSALSWPSLQALCIAPNSSAPERFFACCLRSTKTGVGR